MVQVVEDLLVDKHVSSDFRSRNRKDQQKSSTRVSWKLVNIVSKLVYNHLRGLTTHLYRAYNPFTKYHGHPFGKLTWQ